MKPRTPADSLIVLITGATAGFGAAMARRFIAEGARVIATGRRAERLDALKKELGERCHTAVMDVTDMQSIDAVLAGLPPDFAAVNVLVNNAGMAVGLEPSQRAAWEDWRRMIDTNVIGLTYMTHALLPGMVERGRGHVINLGSVAGSYAYPGSNVYGATKAFVRQLSLNLLTDLLGTPLRVTNIEPGLCETEFSEVRFGGDKEKAAKVYRGTEPIVADDIAETVFWCATLPAHVNINRLEIMPVDQAFGPFAIHRREDA